MTNSREFFRENLRAISQTRRTGLSALRAARVRGGSSRDDCRRGRGRKEGSKGGKKARLCKQRSQFSRRMLRAASAPPQDPSPSRTFSSSFSCPFLPPPALPSCAFPSTFSLCVTLCSLSPLTALNCRQRVSLLTGDYLSPSREAERRICCCTGGLRHCV